MQNMQNALRLLKLLAGKVIHQPFRKKGDDAPEPLLPFRAQ